MTPCATSSPSAASKECPRTRMSPPVGGKAPAPQKLTPLTVQLQPRLSAHTTSILGRLPHGECVAPGSCCPSDSQLSWQQAVMGLALLDVLQDIFASTALPSWSRTDQAVDGCGLAGTIWSQKAQQLALGHTKPAVCNSHVLPLLLLLRLLGPPKLPPPAAAGELVHFAQAKDLDEVLLACPAGLGLCMEQMSSSTALVWVQT